MRRTVTFFQRHNVDLSNRVRRDTFDLRVCFHEGFDKTITLELTAVTREMADAQENAARIWAEGHISRTTF